MGEKTLYETILDSIQKKELTQEAFARMLANSLESNAILLKLTYPVEPTMNGEKVLEEFITTRRGIFTGLPLLNYLKTKGIQNLQERESMLQKVAELLGFNQFNHLNTEAKP